MSLYSRTKSFHKRFFTAITVILLLVFSQAALADITLPGIFGDHMVFQRDLKIPVWGKADPGEEITVTLGEVSKKVKTDDDGTWMVRLKKMKAGGPYEMTVTGKNTITFGDVMIGEVWLCAGQSNMEARVRGSNPDELTDADNPNIRMITLAKRRDVEPQDDFMNDSAAWTVCSPETVNNFSAVAYFFGRDIYRELDVPIGLINSSWGGMQAENWVPPEYLEKDPLLNPIIGRWEELVAEYPEAQKKYQAEQEAWRAARTAGGNPGNRPAAPVGASAAEGAGGLYNAMIHPMIPYGIRGAVWYQGESNSQRGYQYRSLMKTMINCWRAEWGQGKFPFLLVQLPNWETDTNPYTPKDGGNWPELREAQLMTLKVPNTALAVTIDLGEEGNIHPRNKWDVGYRLALGALNTVYGYDVEYSGPLYKSVKIKKNTAVVKFDHDDGLTAQGGALKGFEIAGADKVYHPAKASIDGSTVIVTSPDVPEPKAVRYAWDDNPECNLYNAAGLPASPFRSDNWERETQNNLRPFSWDE